MTSSTLHWGIHADDFTKVFGLGNLLHIIPGSFRNLTNLQYLLLKKTGLTNLTNNAFWGLKQLKYLEISESYIYRPKKISRRAFNSLDSLEYLSLEENEIDYLFPSVFNGLLSLKELVLRKNYLRTISMEVNKLEILDLSNNRLSILDENSFRGSGSSMKYLDLRWNQISAISENTFRNISFLRELHLSNNELRELPSGIFQDLSDLQTL
ncbi:toll-like receptor 3 [Oculina patagonica]